MQDPPYEVVIPGPNGEPYHVYQTERADDGGYWSRSWEHDCVKGGPFRTHDDAVYAAEEKIDDMVDSDE